MICRIYLIRHGETQWNKAMRFQGHRDIPLSEKGLEQAMALSCRLSSENIKSVYSSDLVRAVETADQIAKPHGLEVIKESALREINFGQWEGLTYNEIKVNHGELIAKWWKNPMENSTPGGEKLSQLVNRIVPVVRNIVERHMGENVVVVCHGGTVKALIGTILHMDLNKYWKIRQDNASLNILEFQDWDSGTVTLLNDCHHLPDDLKPIHWSAKMLKRSG